MRKSIFLRFFGTFMLINISFMFILTTIIASIVNTYDTSMKTDTLKSSADYVIEYVIDGMEKKSETSLADYVSSNHESIKQMLDLMSVNVNDFIMFIADENGHLLLAGGADTSDRFGGEDGFYSEGEETHLLPQWYLDSARSLESVEGKTDLDGLFDGKYFVYSAPITSSSGEFIGAVVSCTGVQGISTLLGGMIKTISISTFWILLALFVAVYFISERLVSPLRVMSRAAKQFAIGQFDVRVPVHGDDEVAELAKAFNNMPTSLSTNEEMRRVFLANVSHDLRTPMTTISGFIDGILDGAIPKEKHEYYLGVIASEVRRLSRLVSTLLDISKIQAGERKFKSEPFDICEMCRQVLISSEQRIEAKKLDVDFVCSYDNMYVLGDPDAIHQVVYNLFDNGIKFASEGGRYVIEIMETGQKIEVSVYNDGLGIQSSDIPFVFDRFYKSDRSRGLDKSGVGLGLYISRTIIEAHGERISVDSEYGKWCRFRFTLPKCAKPKNLISTDRNRNIIGG